MGIQIQEKTVCKLVTCHTSEGVISSARHCLHTRGRTVRQTFFDLVWLVNTATCLKISRRQVGVRDLIVVLGLWFPIRSCEIFDFDFNGTSVGIESGWLSKTLAGLPTTCLGGVMEGWRATRFERLPACGAESTPRFFIDLVKGAVETISVPLFLISNFELVLTDGETLTLPATTRCTV